MQNQFQTLRNWTTEVFNSIKKDLRNDHLPADLGFYKTYFGNRPLKGLTTEEIFAAYEKELLQGNEQIAAFVVNRWVFKHGDLYKHFADRLSAINPDFDEIQQLTDEQAEQVLEGAVENFGIIPTFLFTVLNGVVFPQGMLERLEVLASEARRAQDVEESTAQEMQSLEKILASHQRELARLQDKIDGVQKKYARDTEALKKQVKALQKRLHG